MLSHTAIPNTGLLQSGDWEHSMKKRTYCGFIRWHNCGSEWFSIPCLIIVNLPFAFLTVAKHWAGVFIKLTVILRMLMSYLHHTRVYLGDCNQLRAHHFIWKGRIAPFLGVHHFIFMDIKHHLPSYSAVIQFCTIHLSSWLISLLPQKYCVVNKFYPLASSSRWFMSLLSCKGPSITLCRSLLVTSPHSANRPLAPGVCF